MTPSPGILANPQRRAQAALGPLLLAVGVAAAGLPACSSVPMVESVHSSRGSGEGYAGLGQRIILIKAATGEDGMVDSIRKLATGKREEASVELRYLGLDDMGRARFERRDSDPAAVPLDAGSTGAPAAVADLASVPHRREISLDLRLARQIRIQGKIIEVLEASPSGVVFRVY